MRDSTRAAIAGATLVLGLTLTARSLRRARNLMRRMGRVERKVDAVIAHQQMSSGVPSRRPDGD